MGADRALIERFLEMMAAQAGAARNTIAAYRSDLMLASEALGGELASADAASLARLGDGWAGLARSTVGRKAAALRRFFAFLAEEGLRGDDPGRSLPTPGSRRALPKVLSHADVDRLFAVVDARLRRERPTASDLRLSALLEAKKNPACSRVFLYCRSFMTARRSAGRTRQAPPAGRRGCRSGHRPPACLNCSTAPAFARANWCRCPAIRSIPTGLS